MTVAMKRNGLRTVLAALLTMSVARTFYTAFSVMTTPTTPAAQDAPNILATERGSPLDVLVGVSERNRSTGTEGERDTVRMSSWIEGVPEHWLTSKRLGNSLGGDDDNDIVASHEFARDAILRSSPLSSRDGSKSLLERTICTNNSRFLNWESRPFESIEGDVLDSDAKVRDVAFRLTYLAIHEYQHRPARGEVDARTKCVREENCRDRLREAGVGPFDYSCPDAKFLVSWVGIWGLGASITLGGVYSVFQAIASGRVPLLLNSVPGDVQLTGPAKTYLKRKWTLASCERQDLQCVFLPLSPCVITHDELASAPSLNDTELDNFRNTRRLPPEYENERVVIVGNDLNRRDYSWRRAMHNSRELRGALTDIIRSWYRDAVVGAAAPPAGPWNFDEAAVEKVLAVMATDEYIVDDAALFYILRPNLRWRPKIEEMSKKTIPEGFDPETAIGLPVRSSDKCLQESECLSFEDYMEVALDLARRASRRKGKRSSSQTKTYDKIVLTSESLQMLRKRFDYPRNDSFPFDFIVNGQDVTQGTGDPKDFPAMEQLNVTSDDIMFSAVSAILTQLHAESTVGNCCSNFHQMMQGFLGRGCGAARKNHFECLHHNPKPEFRIRCGLPRTRGVDPFTRQKRDGIGGRFEVGSDMLHPDIDLDSAQRFSRNINALNKRRKYLKGRGTGAIASNATQSNAIPT